MPEINKPMKITLEIAKRVAVAARNILDGCSTPEDRDIIQKINASQKPVKDRCATKQDATIASLVSDGWKISRKDKAGRVWMTTPPHHPATGARVFRNGNLRADYYDDQKGHCISKLFYASQFVK
jgi:hypothetical protein